MLSKKVGSTLVESIFHGEQTPIEKGGKHKNVAVLESVSSYLYSCMYIVCVLLPFYFKFLARLDEVQEELLYYPWRRRLGVGGSGGSGGDSKILKFYVKVFM